MAGLSSSFPPATSGVAHRTADGGPHPLPWGLDPPRSTPEPSPAAFSEGFTYIAHGGVFASARTGQGRVARYLPGRSRLARCRVVILAVAFVAALQSTIFGKFSDSSSDTTITAVGLRTAATSAYRALIRWPFCWRQAVTPDIVASSCVSQASFGSTRPSCARCPMWLWSNVSRRTRRVLLGRESRIPPCRTARRGLRRRSRRAP